MIRHNPLFPKTLNELSVALGTYWRELANWANGLTTRANKWSGGQSGSYFSLTSTSASIAINLSLSNNFNHTLTESTTLAAPTNAVAGQSGVIHLTQHASAPKTLAYNTFWKFAGGTAPTLTATNGAIDVLSYVVNPGGTSAVCVLIKDVK
jgi:hypothetical protein